MTCKECSYCYKTDEDDFPCCQFRKLAPFDIAPCEYEAEAEECDDFGY